MAPPLHVPARTTKMGLRMTIGTILMLKTLLPKNVDIQTVNLPTAAVRSFTQSLVIYQIGFKYFIVQIH